MTGIVVGVDGSAESKVALLWAADEARRRKVPLRVVMVIDNPNRDMWIPRIGPGDDWQKVNEGRLERLVRGVLGEPDDVRVEEVIVEGPAARTLLDSCRDADLLVVGNRGRGGFGGVTLGSVSLHCAAHAPCPVVVVRKTKQQAPA